MASSLLENQVEELASDLSFFSIDDNEKIRIETELKLMDIPFNWNLHQAKPDGDNAEVIASELKRKLKEMLDNDSELTFKSFCCQLTLAQELIKYDTESALKKVEECEPWVVSLKNGDCKEHEFVSISEAVEYIYLGCKAFALFKCGSIAEAKQVLCRVPDLKNMEIKQRSGIYGMKAWAYMEYGVSGFLKALECISIARSNNPTMAEWHFLTGKIMSRIRHVKFPFMTVSDEEENFYRTAYKMDESKTSYKLYMAQITREKSFGLFQENRYSRESNKELLERLDKMNAEALSLYTSMIQSNQTDSNLLARTAFGMVKLPDPYKRIDLAVQAIETALEVSPDNPLANHYAGLIYYRHVKDNLKGLKYLERAAKQKNFPALLDWLKLKYAVDPSNYDPIPELTKALEFDDYASATLTEMSSWYFFKKDNVFRAWDHLKKVTDDHFAKNHKCPFLRMKNPCNLFEVIFDEVKLMISQGKYKNEREKEDLLSMSKKLQALCPQSHPTDYSNFKAVILNESDELVMREQWRLYGRGRGRGGARNRGGLSRGSTSSVNGSTCNTRGSTSSARGSTSSARGSTSSARGSRSTSRRGSNTNRSSSQTDLSNVDGKKSTNHKRDSHSRCRGKSNRGNSEACNPGRNIQTESESNSIQEKSVHISDLAGGISMKNVLTEKLFDMDSEYKHNLNILFGNKLDLIGDATQKSETAKSGNLAVAEASCSTRNHLFYQKKPKDHGQPKRPNENYSTKYDNLGNVIDNLCLNFRDISDNNNLSGSSSLEQGNKNLRNVSSHPRKTQQPCHNLNIAPQTSSSCTDNNFSEVKYDNFGKKITQKSMNFDKEFSENSRKQKDEKPSYYPQSGSQVTNFTTNTFE